MRRVTTSLTVALLAVALSNWALADEAPSKDKLVLPDGVGPVKLGMTIPEAKAAMPALVVDDNVAAKADPPLPFKYAVGELNDQPFGDLKGCKLTLHFYRERFIYFGVLCPDKAAMQAYLLKTYGKPGVQQADVWQWTTQPRGMTMVPTSGAVAVADTAGSQAYQLELMNLAMQGQHPVTTPGAGTAPQSAAPAKP